MSSFQGSPALRVLCLEDDPCDQELVVESLRSGGLNPVVTCARTRPEFEQALAAGEWDVILSDYTLPSYSGDEALAAAQRHRPETPFLFVSGTIGEDRAVGSLKAGATDYILKHQLARLPSAVCRALQEAELRKARKMAEAASRESEAKFRSYVQDAPLAFLVFDGRLRNLDSNPAASKLLGYAAAELRQLRMEDLVPVEDRELMTQGMSELVKNGQVEGECRLRRRDETLVWVFSRAVRIGPDRYLALCTDISERRRAEERLSAFSRMGQRLSAAGSAREAAEIIVEFADQLLGWDACSFEVCESPQQLECVLSVDTIQGRRTENHAHPAHSPPSDLAREVMTSGGRIVSRDSVPQTTVNPKGSASPLARTCYVPVRFGSHVVALLSISSYTPGRYAKSDLELLQMLADHGGGALNRIRLCAEHQRLEAQFRQAQKMEAIGQLAGGVAHDFNNLLAVMRGYADLLLMDADRLPSEALESLRQIIAAGDRAASLTRQLLVFSRKQVMQAKPLDLNLVITELTKMLRRVIGEQIHLECQCAESLPMVFGDASMMEQVLVNLAVNARDAMPEGGHLRLATRRASLGAGHVRSNPEARQGEFVRLEVSDTGTGIAPEVLPHIFEPFFTTKEAGKGTGLGLATVYGVIKQHQGWIEVRSGPKSGTIFNVYLPVLRCQTAPVRAPATPPRPCGGKETILLVEDELSVRAISRRVLEKHGYTVLEASSAPEALALWKAHAERISLLLTDVVMPNGLTGFGLAEQLCIERPGLKTIFMSGYSPESISPASEFLRARKGFFLQKPCAAQKLVNTVRQCLDGAGS